MFDRLPAWAKNKWILFGGSFLAALLIGFLFIFVLLRGPFASLMTNAGERALENRDYSKAAAKFSVALDLKKNREEIYQGYGEALAGMGQYDEAIDLMDRGIAKISGAQSLYLAKTKFLTKSGRIGTAVRFLDTIKDDFISKKLRELRPADLTYSPQQGKYGSTQKVTIQVRDGEKVYYTLNGEEPTAGSMLYKEPITVSATCTLTAVAVNEEGLVSPLLKVDYEIDNANEPITFADSKVEKMVRAALERPSGRLYASHLATVTELTNQEIDGEIQSLKDLEYLPNLRILRLSGELTITDYSPISGLSVLEILDLSGCVLSDEDLRHVAPLSGLKQLSLNNNRITSLEAISELTELDFLNLASNRLTTVKSFSPFTKLEYLHLQNNEIYDLDGLSSLNELIYLDLSDNEVTNLSPISALFKLQEVLLNNNPLSNIKVLSDLPMLNRLEIENCEVTSLSVVNDFKALEVLAASDNQIASLSTFTRKVRELYLAGNPLADLSPLKEQTELTVLDASDTAVSDVSCFAAHPALSTMDISGTSVTDATALKDCANLTFLLCTEGCVIEGLPETVEVIYK